MPTMDAFDGNAFSMQTLTAALLDRPHVPSRLGELGIFQAEGVPTIKVSIERQGNTLVLIPVTARNGPATQNTKDQRTIVDIPIPRLAVEDTITADEVQGIRAFGSESQLDTLFAEVNRRAERMSRSLVATEEFHRVGAMKGLVLDADSTTLLDLFSTFGVAAPTEVAFDFAGTAEGGLRPKCSALIRQIEDQLGGLPYTHVHAECSSQFFDDLTSHVEYRANKKGFEDARELNARIARRATEFGGITWEEYRGAVGGTKYVADDKVHFFPVGVPDLFISRYGPAEYWDTVNTIGLPRYVRMNPDGTDPDHKRTIRVQTHPLHICTRPGVLIPGRRGV